MYVMHTYYVKLKLLFFSFQEMRVTQRPERRNEVGYNILQEKLFLFLIRLEHSRHIDGTRTFCSRKHTNQLFIWVVLINYT